MKSKPASIHDNATTAPPPAASRATLWIATALFFLSGALGLGYELVWLRKAALMVGATQIALSTVLTAFFLGLALGSEVFGRSARFWRRSPLLLYAVLEVGVGLYALAFPWLFGLIKAVYAQTYPLVEGVGPALFALRFALLFLLFLLPTFLMGGTLPLLLDALVQSDRTIGTRTSFLYGTNILGAVIGVLVTGYLAIPALGVEGTSMAGGLGNLAVGAVAVLAFRKQPAHETRAAVPLARFFPAAACATGLLAIGYQICWARYFALFTFTSVYFTAAFLAVYLLALAAGSFVLAPLLARRVSPLRVVGWVQALVPLCVLVTLKGWRLAEYRFVMAEIPEPHEGFRPLATFEMAQDHPQFWHLLGETADAIFVAPLLQVGLVLFVPVVLIGTALPALIAAAARHPSDLRAVSGRLVFWNNVGAAAGGFLAGYALLPLCGLHGSLVALGLGSVGLSCATWFRRTPVTEAGRVPRLGLAAAAASLVALAAFAGLREDVTRETLRHHLTFQREPSQLEFVEVEEGPLTTAYVTRQDRVLRIGSGSLQMGHVTEGEVSGQALAGHFPALFYPGRGSPRTGLGICLGSGQTFGALLRYPLERLDVVEISGEITRLASRHLSRFNQDLLRDPRVRLHLDDGRHFIERAADASYDVVSLEAPPPTSDGVYVLYSEEFFLQVRRVLRPGGVFVHILPLYFLTPDDTRAVLRTLAAVFPETFVAKVTMGDYLLLAYPSRPTFDRKAIAERTRILSTEWTSRGLPAGQWWRNQVFPLDTFQGVVSTLLAGPEALDRVESPVVLRDDRQLLSYGTGDRGLARRYQGNPLIHISFGAIPVVPPESLAAYFDPPLAPSEIDQLYAARTAVLFDVNVRDARRMAQKVRDLPHLQDPDQRATLALALALDYDAALRKVEAYAYLELSLATLRDRPDLVRDLHRDAVRKIVRNRLAVYTAEAEACLARCNSLGLGGPLVDILREEIEGFKTREAAVARRYLFPGFAPAR